MIFRAVMLSQQRSAHFFFFDIHSMHLGTLIVYIYALSFVYIWIRAWEESSLEVSNEPATFYYNLYYGLAR